MDSNLFDAEDGKAASQENKIDSTTDAQPLKETVTATVLKMQIDQLEESFNELAESVKQRKAAEEAKLRAKEVIVEVNAPSKAEDSKPVLPSAPDVKLFPKTVESEHRKVEADAPPKINEKIAENKTVSGSKETIPEKEEKLSKSVESTSKEKIVSKSDESARKAQPGGVVPEKEIPAKADEKIIPKPDSPIRESVPKEKENLKVDGPVSITLPVEPKREEKTAQDFARVETAPKAPVPASDNKDSTRKSLPKEPIPKSGDSTPEQKKSPENKEVIRDTPSKEPIREEKLAQDKKESARVDPPLPKETVQEKKTVPDTKAPARETPPKGPIQEEKKDQDKKEPPRVDLPSKETASEKKTDSDVKKSASETLPKESIQEAKNNSKSDGPVQDSKPKENIPKEKENMKTEDSARVTAPKDSNQDGKPVPKSEQPPPKAAAPEKQNIRSTLDATDASKPKETIPEGKGTPLNVDKRETVKKVFGMECDLVLTA